MSHSSDPGARDLYARLGVDPAADDQAVKRAAQEAQKEYHPDHNPDPDSTAQFQRVREAAECLTDPDERTAYDEFYDRFGPERAAEAYDRWTSYGRTQPAETFSPGFASSVGPSTAGGSQNGSSGEQSRSQRRHEATQTGSRRGTTDKSSATHGHQNGGTENSSQSRSGDATSSASSRQSSSSTADSSETSSGRRTHTNFDHRQEYEREEYEAPFWASLKAWPRVEVGQTARDVGAVIALGVVTAVGVLLTAVAGFVFFLGIYVVGTVVAAFEFLLRAAGVVRFDAYRVAEVGLTWVLEIGVYAGVLFVAFFLYSLSFERDREAHLGNRLGLPHLILVLPVSVLIGGGLWIGRPDLLAHVTPQVDPRAGFVLIAALWPSLSRSTRLLLETAPNHSGESMLDSAGSVLFYGGAGSLVLAAYLLAVRLVVGSGSEPLEDTLVAQHLPPRLLLAAGLGAAGVSLIAGLVLPLVSAVRKKL